MTSAAVLFYGRRSRSSRSFNDLGFGSAPPSPSSSSSSSSSSDLSKSGNQRHRHRHRRGDSHRRHRHINFDDHDHFRHSSHISRSSISGSEQHQQACNDEPPSQDINNRETVNGLSGRYQRNNRLPGSVLLARERLVQRLRGVSVSDIRESRETSPSLPGNHSWMVDADWETSGTREEPASYTILTELPVRAHQSAQREPQTKPLGLTSEALAELHHEVFMEQQNPVTPPNSRSSNECSICLESFVEGNNLINLPCGHRFHSSCLYPWLQTCGKCPYCRSCIMFFS